MSLTKGRIEREGRVSFGDAILHITEEGISAAREQGGWAAEFEWERQFKKQVFLRIVQQLNRLGWTCIVPPDYIEQYGLTFARSRRECHKGELRGHLEVSGRCITFEMWQGVNTPTRSDHGGRYEHNKEAIAPYLLRLEMYRTRNRIRDYLCNVFSGYEFRQPKLTSANPDPLAYFNQTWDGEYEIKRGTHRFERREDGWSSDKEINWWDRTDADGQRLNHGDIRWSRDSKGRLLQGKVYGGINGMWLFVYGSGHGAFSHCHCKDLFTLNHGLTPRKENQHLRRRRLESELSKAVVAMEFERAAKLRDLLFHKDEQLFVVWHKGHNLYHGPGFCGYTGNINRAGKFTAAEVEGWSDDLNEVRPLRGK